MTEAREARVGRVQTVRGPISPEELGPTMPHEHVLIDLQCNLHPAPPEAGLGADWVERPITPETRADAVHWPETIRDDLLIDDDANAIWELGLLRDAGGGAVIDATTIGIGRDPEALRRISEASGIHISMGTGWYVFRSHAAEIDERSEDDLADQMVREIEVGVGETGIRAGHIGEIGAEGPTDLEFKVLRAAAQAQGRTGAMLLIHQVYVPGDRVTQHRLLDAVEGAGGDISRTVLAHMDRTGMDPEQQLSLLERGANVLYDIWGYEQSRGEAWGRPVPSDAIRIRDFARLIEAGYRDQILASQDICLKTMLTRYGGSGYAHILRRVVPGMRALGLSQADIDAIIVANPRRLLTFVAPTA
jgi:phosphotriesterase-related protein